MGSDDLNLSALIDFPAYDILSDPGVKTDGLREVASAYVANMGRVRGLFLLPTRVWINSYIMTRAVDEAYLHIMKEFGPLVDDTPFSEHPRYHEIQDFAAQRWWEFMGFLGKDNRERDAAKKAYESIQRQVGTAFTHESFQPWLSSLVIGSWTAVESLATDLWMTAVNMRPMSLGEKAINAPRRKGDDEPTEDAESREPKVTAIKLDWLRKYKYNLSSSLGTVLKELGKKWNFNKLQGIAHAYGDVFLKPGRDVFSGQDYEALGSLEAVRHLLTHRGGEVDQQFLDRVGGKPAYSHLKKKDRIELDGPAVASHIGTAVRFSASLFAFVDQWLADHPE